MSPSIERLPSELHKHIFQYLSQHDQAIGMTVSWSWLYHLLPLLWSKVHLNNEPAFLGSRVLFSELDGGHGQNHGQSQDQGQQPSASLHPQRYPLTLQSRRQLYFSYIRDFSTKYLDTIAFLAALSTTPASDSDPGQGGLVHLTHAASYLYSGEETLRNMRETLSKGPKAAYHRYQRAREAHLLEFQNARRLLLKKERGACRKQETDAEMAAAKTLNNNPLLCFVWDTIESEEEDNDGQDLIKLRLQVEDLGKARKERELVQLVQHTKEEEYLLRILEAHEVTLRTIRLQRHHYAPSAMIQVLERGGFKSLRSFTWETARRDYVEEGTLVQFLECLPDSLETLALELRLAHFEAEQPESESEGNDEELEHAIRQIALVDSDRAACPPPTRTRDLRHLGIKGPILTGGPIHRVWTPFLKECADLKEFELGFRYCVDLPILATALRKYCSKLEALIIGPSCTGPTATMMDHHLAALIQSFSGNHLKRLQILCGCEMGRMSEEALRFQHKSLEVVKVLETPSFEPLILLENCPKLKELYGFQEPTEPGFSQAAFSDTAFAMARVDAREAIALENVPWACVEMKIWAIVVKNISRPDLKRIDHHGMQTLSWQQVGEDGGEEPQWSGQEVQRRFLEKLGRLTRLQELRLGFDDRFLKEGMFGVGAAGGGGRGMPSGFRVDAQGRTRYFDRGFQYDSLELTIETGLGSLAGLKELRLLDVRRMAHRIGLEEVKWMVEYWPKLERIEGLFWTVQRREDWDVEMMKVLKEKGVAIDSWPWNDFSFRCG